MPSVSKSQQRLFGMVHACQKSGKCASKEVKDIAKGIGDKDAEDFASTKHKGLPEKKRFKEWLKQFDEVGTSTGSIAMFSMPLFSFGPVRRNSVEDKKKKKDKNE